METQPSRPDQDTSGAQIAAPLGDRQRCETSRLAALAQLAAVRPDADRVLQEVADSARSIFGTALCLVNLVTADEQYFRAWSGDLPPALVRARRIPRDHSMCRHVVATRAALTVADLEADERFPDEATYHHFGMRFYAGAPLVTVAGDTVGSLCLLDPAPRAFDDAQLAILGAFARAAVGRLETLAAVGRERAASAAKDELLIALQAANQAEALRHATELERTLALAHDLIAIVGYDGLIRSINPACEAILGYTPSELIGTQVGAILHPEDFAATVATVGTAVSGLVNRYVRRDGTTAWLEWNATPVPAEGAMYCVARDVTARRAAEAARRASAARFRAIFANAAIGIALVDPEGYPVETNAAFQGLLGYDEAELRGMPFARFTHADDVDADLTLFGELVAGGRDYYQLEKRYIRKDGAIIWCHLTVSLLRDDDGATRYAVGMVEDVTARKVAEEGLADALWERENIMETVPDIIYQLDLDGGLIGWNRRIEETTGYGPDELRGKSALAFFPDHDRDRVAAAIGLAYARGTIEIEADFLRADGASIPHHWTAAPLRDRSGAMIGLTGVGRDIGARRVAEGALRASEATLQAAQRIAGLGSWENDLATGATIWSDEMYRLFGVEPAAFVPTLETFLPLVHPTDRDRVRQWITAGTPGEILTHRLVRPDGEERTVQGQFEVMDDAIGRPSRVIGTLLDITARVRAEGALRASETHYRAIVDTAFDAIVTMDADGILRSFNPGAERLFGWTADEIVGRPLTTLMPERFHAAHRSGLERYITTNQARILGRVIEMAGRHRDGREFPIELSIAAIQEGGRQLFTGILRDVGERKAFEEQLRHQTFHDPLTTLPNRALLLERLQHALAQVSRGGARPALLLLDLNGFKVINDSLGHAAGDRLLIAVADRLAAAMRPGDTIARLGGDEFAVLLDRAADIHEVTGIATRLLDTLAMPLALEGRELVVEASLGIALAVGGETRPDDLLRDADLALYRAKEGGRASYAVYDASLHAAANARLALEAELRRALASEEFVLHYQPKVDLATGCLAGVEALVRWHHPTRGLVPPGEFIPLAEETGLIVPLGRWVLMEACHQARAWADTRIADPPLTMSVNLSARQFRQPDLVGDVAQILRDTGVTPALIQLEITEGVLMEDAAATLGLLERLRGLGVALAIDDFGTGYSSLAYLKRFPIDVLKVDKAFVTGLERDSSNGAIATAVIGLAHALGLTVTAEGVETAGERDQLRSLGCELGQGYFFARPMPAAKLAALLADERGSRSMLWCDDAVSAYGPAHHP